jgi:hypothetical protein
MSNRVSVLLILCILIDSRKPDNRIFKICECLDVKALIMGGNFKELRLINVLISTNKNRRLPSEGFAVFCKLGCKYVYVG